LIIGYDDKKREYKTLSYKGEPMVLPYKKLGQNDIKILSVTIPSEPNQRSRDEIISNSLKTAMAHAEQKEWADRPKYQNGPPAYDAWALIYDRWAMIVEAGKGDNIKVDICGFSSYYASHYCSARCYARDYLKSIAGEDELLLKAASEYEKVASHLKSVWELSPRERIPNAEDLRTIARKIKGAGAAEEGGIRFIKGYLRKSEQTV
jgi:hypothetical protein